MALIETNPDPTVQTVRLIKDTVTGCYQQIRTAFQNGLMLVWQNPFGLTPQQVLDALGPDAATLFDYSNDIVAVLNKPVPQDQQITSVVPAGMTATVNQDGTVTLS